MKTTFKILTIASLPLLIVGCLSADEIKPSDVARYQNPNQLIAGKGLNGKNNQGKEYMLTTNIKDPLIPHAYMKNLCISQGGTFKQLVNSAFAQLDSNKNQGNVAHRGVIAHAIGTFKCDSSKPWNIEIEPQSSRVNYQQGLNFVTLKTSVLTDFQTQNKISQYQRFSQRQQEEADWRQKQKREQQLAQQQKAEEYQRNKILNAPTKNDIGQTICKDSELSEHTGYIVMGRNTYNKVQGVVVASLEDFSTNGSNLKINIKGWLSDRNQIGSGSNVLYKQTPLESGRVIWDNKQGWFKCNY